MLVVDDEPTVREVVGQYLARDGFRVVTTGDGREVTALVERESPHLVVLDVMLPGIGGLELCRAIRARWPIPVILLTARGEETDRIVGLELGADDYVTKPFSPRELVARVRAVLRRGSGEDLADLLQFGDFEIDVPAREVRCAASRFASPRASSTCSRSSPGTRGACSPASRSCRACGDTRRPSTPGRCRCTCAVCARRSRTIRARRGASRPSERRLPLRPLMLPFAFTLALCSLGAGIAGGLALRLLPTLSLRLAGLALLASGLPLIAVVASGLIMFDTRHDALVTLVAAAASASALVGALLVSRSISLPLRALRRTARRLAEGELEARAPISGPSELRDVARRQRDERGARRTPTCAA